MAEAASFVCVELGLAEIEAMLALQAEAIAEHAGTEQFAPLSETELRAILGGQGHTVGMYEAHEAGKNGRLVAYQNVVGYGAAPENLGHDLRKLPCPLDAVLNLEESIVTPQARGHRLNDRMIAANAAWGRAKGFRLMATTISPWNVGSLISHFRGGFELAALVEKYGGSARYVVAMPL